MGAPCGSGPRQATRETATDRQRLITFPFSLTPFFVSLPWCLCHPILLFVCISVEHVGIIAIIFCTTHGKTSIKKKKTRPESGAVSADNFVLENITILRYIFILHVREASAPLNNISPLPFSPLKDFP